LIVALGGIVVSVLAIGSSFAGSHKAEGDGFLRMSARKGLGIERNGLTDRES
jgi:hypothetical protein